MTYNKPEVVVLGDANLVVCCSNPKVSGPSDGITCTPPQSGAGAAYDLDA